MITVPGTLLIRTLQGRNGVFSVGRLHTDIGSFAVKDALLDQYEPGRYAGLFDIARIHPAAYPCQGQMVVEVRARLTGMVLETVQATPNPPPQDIATDPAEPDLSPPAEEAPPEEPPARPTDPALESRGQAAPPGGPAGEDGPALFGPLWPLGQTVRLDATVDRPLLRRQRDRLKALGYRFDAKTQTWSTPEDWLAPG